MKTFIRMREDTLWTIWNTDSDVGTLLTECMKTHSWLCRITPSDVWNIQSNIWKYSLEYRKLIIRIPGNTPSNTWGYSFECAKTRSLDYVKCSHGCENTNDRMHENTSVVVWNYSIGYMKTPSRIHGAFYRMHEDPQSIHENIYRSIKITHSNTWKHSIECMKSFIRVFESALLATWNTEYMKLLPWIHGNIHSDIGSNQLDTLRYAIECIKNTRSNT